MNRFKPYLISLLILTMTGLCQGANLVIDSQQGKKNQAISFSIGVNQAPKDAKAFIMDIEYDFTSLKFEKFQKGELGKGYALLKVNNIAPGVLRIGGVDPYGEAVKAGDSGELLNLSFKVVGENNCDVKFGVLKDDITDWNTQDGLFTYDPKKADGEDDKDQDESGNGKLNKENPYDGFGSGYPEGLNDVSPSDESLPPKTEDQTDSFDKRIAENSGIPGVNERSGAPGVLPNISGNSLPNDARGNNPIKSPQGMAGGVNLTGNQPVDASVPSKPKVNQPARPEQGNLPGTPSALNTHVGIGGVPGSPSQYPTRYSNSTQSPQGEFADQGLTRLIIIVLLVVVLVLAALVLAVLAAILVVMVMILKKLSALEKSGKLAFQNPLSINPGRDGSPLHNQKDSLFV